MKNNMLVPYLAALKGLKPIEDFCVQEVSRRPKLSNFNYLIRWWMRIFCSEEEIFWWLEECTCLWVIQHACVSEEEDRENNFRDFQNHLAIHDCQEVRLSVRDRDHEIGNESGCEMVFEVQQKDPHDENDDLEEDLSIQEFRKIQGWSLCQDYGQESRSEFHDKLEFNKVKKKIVKMWGVQRFSRSWEIK